MFSKELENLIQATLEDGVLEENEKAALIKRAQREGVDLDELEIYINSLLQKQKRELKKKNDELDAKYENEKKEAFGRTCPNCGKQVPPLTLKCECGYEFTSSKSVSSVEVLSEKINSINSAPYKNSNPNSEKYKAEKKEREDKILSIISMFPVPNTKEDIIEFLSMSAPFSKKKGGLWGSILNRWIIIILLFVVIGATIVFISKDPELFILCMAAWPLIFLANVGNDLLEWNKKAEIWRSKFDQVLMKGRSLRGDADFQRQLDYFENMIKK